MSRVIIIGNSHVASIKQAWNSVPQSERRHDVRFFAAHGPNFQKLALDPTLRFGLTRRRAAAEPEVTKKVRAINGALGIKLSSADIVVWAGYLWPMTPIAQLIAQFDIDDLREVGAARRLSRGAFNAICDEFAESRIPGERWRDWSSPKLILHMRPLPVDTCVQSANPVYTPWEPILRKPAGSKRVLDTFLDCFEKKVSPFGIEMLRQPAATQAESGLTLSEYSRIPPSGITEYNHMNPAFGALSLRAILARAHALSASHPAPSRDATLVAGSTTDR